MIVVDEESISVANDESGCPAGLFPSDCQRFPNALAGGGTQAAKLAVAADTIDVVAIEDGGGDQGVQAVGVDFAVAFALPEFEGRLFGKVQKHRPVIKGTDEQARVVHDWCGQVDAIVNLEGLLPVHFASGWVERDYRERMPHD